MGRAETLFDVTFVILDLETTGTSPEAAEITEVGAVKYRGGELLGTFHSFVRPSFAVPQGMTRLSVTTDAVAAHPTIDAVLPSLLEFLRGAVVVGHNVRFDLSFLRAAAIRLGYDPLTNVIVDTLALSRRLLGGELADCRLKTVAHHFGTAASPNHRALDDARATAEVLHRFLEVVGNIGVTDLDDLLELPHTARNPQFAKLRWVAKLPYGPGVYVLRDLHGVVVLVGSADDLRAGVRRLFARSDRRCAAALAQAVRLEHQECASGLERAVRELRLVHEHRPRGDPRSKALQRRRYLRARSGPIAGTWRAAIVTADRDIAPGEVRLGPFQDAAAARAALPKLAQLSDAASPWEAMPIELRARRSRIDQLLAAGRVVVNLDSGTLTIRDGVLDLGSSAWAPTTAAAIEDEAHLLATQLDGRALASPACSPPSS